MMKSKFKLKTFNSNNIFFFIKYETVFLNFLTQFQTCLMRTDDRKSISLAFTYDFNTQKLIPIFYTQ
jgi:hypothetical protein